MKSKLNQQLEMWVKVRSCSRTSTVTGTSKTLRSQHSKGLIFTLGKGSSMALLVKSEVVNLAFYQPFCRRSRIIVDNL
jgi:hypothetical protein